MSNNAYDWLKISALIIIPAIAAFIGSVGETWGWKYTIQIVATINAISALIGSIITKLSLDYAKRKEK